MLALRNLHSCNSPKPKELQVKNVIETYNFDGMKKILDKNTKKEHPYYSMFFLKYGIKGVSQKTFTAENGFKTHLGNPDNPKPYTTKSHPDKPAIMKSPIKQAKKSAAVDDAERLFMSYAAFQKLFYQHKQMKVVRQPVVTHKCTLCSRKFTSRVMLQKHIQLCPKKHVKKLTTKMKKPSVVKTAPAPKKPVTIFPCTVCTDHFFSRTALDMHVKYDHRPRPTCSKCSKIFDSRRRLLDHEESCAGLHCGEPSKKQTLGAIDFKATKEIFMCSKCENPFPSNDELRQHKLLLNKRNPLPVVLSDEHNMGDCFSNENIEIFIKKRPQYFSANRYTAFTENTCKKCGKSFHNIMRVQQHSVFCHKTLLKSCEYCEKKFRTSKKRNEHFIQCSKMHNKEVQVTVQVEVKSNSVRIFRCMHCRKAFKSLGVLNAHLRTLLYYYCAKCSVMSKIGDVEYRASHFCRVLNGKVMDYADSTSGGYICEWCNRNLKVYPFRRYRGPKHVCKVDQKTKHTTQPSSPDSLKCTDCSYVFKSKPKLQRHIRRKQNKQLSHCQFCACKSYQKSKQLEEHVMLVHRKKVCKTCKQYYSIRKNKPHACLLKEKHAKQKKAVKNAKQKKSKLDQNKPASHQCYQCSKIVDSKNELIHHLVGHSKLVPFKCKYCQRSYKRLHCLNDHLISSHGCREKTFFSQDVVRISHDILECKNCNDLFLGHSDLKEHRMKRHSAAVLAEEKGFQEKQCQFCHREGVLLTVHTAHDNTTQWCCSDCAEKFIPHRRKHDKKKKEKNVAVPTPREHVTCEHCLKTFKRVASLNWHYSSCLKKIKDNLFTVPAIKPAMPSIEACENEGEGELPSICTPAFVSLKEAEESLLSLSVDDCFDETVNEIVTQDEIPVVVNKVEETAKQSKGEHFVDLSESFQNCVSYEMVDREFCDKYKRDDIRKRDDLKSVVRRPSFERNSLKHLSNVEIVSNVASSKKKHISNVKKAKAKESSNTALSNTASSKRNDISNLESSKINSLSNMTRSKLKNVSNVEAYTCECGIHFDTAQSLNIHFDIAHAQVLKADRREECLIRENSIQNQYSKTRLKNENTAGPHRQPICPPFCIPPPPMHFPYGGIRTPYPLIPVLRCEKDILRDRLVAKRGVRADIPPQLFESPGREYYNSVSNYFTGIVQQSKKIVQNPQDTAYLEALQLKIEEDHARESNATRKKSIISNADRSAGHKNRCRKQKHPRHTRRVEACNNNNVPSKTVHDKKSLKKKRFIFPVEEVCPTNAKDVQEETNDFERNVFAFMNGDTCYI